MSITRNATFDANNSGSTTSLSVTFGATATAGRLITIPTFIYDAEINTNTPAGYTKRRSCEHNSQTFHCIIFDKVAAGGETSVTVTKAGSSVTMREISYEWIGALATTPADVGTAAQSGGTSVTSQATGTTATTTQGDEMILTLMMLNGTAAGTRLWDNAGSPLTNLVDTNFTGSRTVSTTGAQSDTFRWTNALFAAGLIQSYMAAAAEDFIGPHVC